MGLNFRVTSTREDQWRREEISADDQHEHCKRHRAYRLEADVVDVAPPRKNPLIDRFPGTFNQPRNGLCVGFYLIGSHGS